MLFFFLGQSVCAIQLLIFSPHRVVFTNQSSRSKYRERLQELEKLCTSIFLVQSHASRFPSFFLIRLGRAVVSNGRAGWKNSYSKRWPSGWKIREKHCWRRRRRWYLLPKNSRPRALVEIKMFPLLEHHRHGWAIGRSVGGDGQDEWRGAGALGMMFAKR